MGALHQAADLAAAEHQNPVAQLQQHIQVFAHIDDGHTGFFLLVNEIVNGIGGVDVQTPDGVGGEQDGGEEVVGAAIESLAENLNDSVVAPLFWFAVAGLPGAALYRLANTADAMWGYRGMREGRYWEWAGKWAAHADDVLSWLPARITALLLALAGGGVRPRALAREARRTPSPNSGWPMAAMALVLDVRLTKPGVYQLHAQGRAPGAPDVARAETVASKVVMAIAGIAGAAIVIVVIEGVWNV